MLKSTVLLSRLKDEVNTLIPECVIHLSSESPPWNEVGAENIERLHGYLRQQYPEAGARYWRVRGWGLLIWQPIYLAVIAAHKCQVILPLNEMGQTFSCFGIPSGVLFKHYQFKQGQPHEFIQHMAKELVSGCHAVLEEWSVSGLPQKNADCIVAECVLSALIMVYPNYINTLEELGNLWLTAMGLEGAAGFIRYKNMTGESRLALDKKSCCFRYLCHSRAPCNDCPRQTMEERLMRLSTAST